MSDTYRELYFDKSDQLLKLMKKASWLKLELDMYKKLYEEANQLLIGTRAKLVEITETIERRPTTRALDLAVCTCQTPVLHPQGYCGYCGLPIPPSQ